MYITWNLSFQDQLHSLNPTHTKKKKKKKKKKNVVGTPGSNQYCQLIALNSNILSLAKSLIGISAVTLTPCLLFPVSQRPPAFLASY